MLKGNYKVKINAKKSVPACTQCLPPAPLKDHLEYNGILVHSRIDCPEGEIYFINEDTFNKL